MIYRSYNPKSVWDIIKMNDLYYVWYSRGTFSHGYDAGVSYATSPDRRRRMERGEALAGVPQCSRDEQSVFTPSILPAALSQRSISP